MCVWGGGGEGEGGGERLVKHLLSSKWMLFCRVYIAKEHDKVACETKNRGP